MAMGDGPDGIKNFFGRLMSLKRKFEEENDSSDDSEEESHLDVAEIHDPNPKYTKYLFGLVVSGRLNELKEENNVNFLTKNDEGDTLLHVSVKQWKTSGKFNLEMIKYLISKKPQLMSETDKEGRTALCYICSVCTDAQCFVIIEALLELYSTSSEALNIADRRGFTPLSQLVISASSFHVKYENHEHKSVSEIYRARSDLLDKYCNTIELLINKGSNINVIDRKGKDLIMLTVDPNGFKEWRPNIVNVLIKNGLKSSIKALKYALIEKSTISDILIENLDVNEKDEDGKGIFYQLLTIDHNVILSPTIQLIKILIEKGADPLTESIHIVHLARNCTSNFELIEYLLNTFPDYDINTKDTDGNTLLLQYGDDLEILEKLLKLNADITAVDNSGNNILHKMMDKKTAITSELFKKFLDLGINPFSCNNKNQFGLLYISRSCLFGSEIDIVHNKLFPLMEEILKKSTYYIENSSMKSIQIGLLEFLYHQYSKSDHNKLAIYSILTKIIKYTNILSTLIIDIPGHELHINSFIHNERIKFQKLTLDPITYMFSIKKYSSNLIEFVYVLLDLGVKLSNNSVNSVTMMLLRNYDIVVKDNTRKNKSIITKLLTNGHSIETSVLKLEELSSIPIEMAQYMQEIKEKFVISDYLMIAFMNNQWHENYVDNCWFPPIFFLYFYIETVKYIVNKWIDVLLPYGNVPCGSPLYEVSRTLLQAAIERNAALFENHRNLTPYYDQLMANQDSPASLRDLSKYAVRFMLAKKAIAQGSSLPKLIEEDVPPTLQFLVKVGHTETSSEEKDEVVVRRRTIDQVLFELSSDSDDATSSGSDSDVYSDF